MNVDALTVMAVRDQLRELIGGRVEKVLLPAELAIGFEIYANRADHWLFASAHPQHARVHLAHERLTAPDDRVSPLLLLLRKYVRGARLVAVEQVPLERVLWLDFQKLDEGELLESRLAIEVMGRYSNVVLVDREGLVLDAVKRVTAEMNRTRVTLPRQPYVLPPPQAKADPTSITAGDLERALAGSAGPLWQGLVGALRAVSPLLARELAFRATGDAGLSAAAVPDWGAVAAAVRTVFADGAAGRWEPTAATAPPPTEGQRDTETRGRGDGSPRPRVPASPRLPVPASPRPPFGEEAGGEEIVAFAPYRLTHLPSRPVGRISEALEAYFDQEEAVGGHEQAKGRLRAAVADARDKLGHKRAALEAGLRGAAEAERLRRSGELLLAFGWQVGPGQRTLEVEGERIAVDPDRSPVENAQAYFREYAKAKSAARGLPDLLARADLELAFLDQALTQIDLAASREEIAAIESELAEAGLLARRGAAKAAGRDGHRPRPGKPARPAPRRKGPPIQSRRSSDGFEILIGRTGRQNDEVTFRLAAPHDLWFHARKVPGAHVILRTGGRSVPDRTIAEAAGIAAAQSQARAAATVPVDFTPVRYVRKIKGAPPGLVIYSGEETVNARPRRIEVGE